MKPRKASRGESFSALAEDIFSRGPFIELRDRKEISIQGCLKIVACTETEVILRLRDVDLRIEGKALCCTTYFAGAVAVRGEITLLSFNEIA